MTFSYYLDHIPSLHKRRILELMSPIERHHPTYRIKFYSSKLHRFPIIVLGTSCCLGIDSRRGYLSLYLSNPNLVQKLCERSSHTMQWKGCIHLLDQEDDKTVMEAFDGLLTQNML